MLKKAADNLTLVISNARNAQTQSSKAMKEKTTTLILYGAIVLWEMVFVPLAYGQAGIEPKDATQGTLQANREMKEKLRWLDRQDFEFAQRGFIARPSSAIVRDASGKTVWNMDQFAFQTIDEPAPATVNPRLWRQEQLNSIYGLFKVTDRVYQVRGYDLSNISIIQGDTGYIVVDPLITAEAAAAAMELVYQHLPRKPVVAVIYSHSHTDHFGGVKGVVSEEDVQTGCYVPPSFRPTALKYPTVRQGLIRNIPC